MMLVLTLLVAFLITVLGTPLLRRFAAARGLLDTPNARSSHIVPTPRLGGIAIAAGTLAGWGIAAALRGGIAGALAVGCGAAASALAGLADDVRGLTPLQKFVGEAIAAILAIWLWPYGFLTVAGAALTVAWIVTYANFFNFMDGSDGLAAAVAVTGAVGLGVLAAQIEAVTTEWLALAAAAAAAGFLVHNRPPATIFMGDSGSLFLGFVLAALAALVCAQGASAPAAGLALTPILVDAGYTLIRRAANGERVWVAHRSHLYQRLIRTGDTHLRVLVIYAAWGAFASALAAAWNTASVPERWGLVLLAVAPAVMMSIAIRRRELKVPSTC